MNSLKNRIVSDILFSLIIAKSHFPGIAGQLIATATAPSETGKFEPKNKVIIEAKG
ncbi:hypothetical protein [Nitrosomonas sp.]|uniref:hypothetical protein n=1 Tax=Nitrosomonas sp. TaxID=42353 RepID=UPI001DA52831|nr:hypothetical protein [Nitrosomonas sp.]MBX3618234.1 hypothetical protein [Nitrosomonas sp.]